MKKKYFKKSVSVLLAFLMVMLAFLPVQLTVSAATDDSDSVGAISESENNDDYASANSFSLNSTISGNMKDSNDKDYFKITPSQNGKIALTLSHNYSSNTDVYWNIAMYAYSSGNYSEFYNQRIYANSGETNVLASIGASSGTTYYIKISTYYNATVGFEYYLKNVFTATNYYEKEINNDYFSATAVTFNQTYGGVMNDDNDVDYYKFSPSSNGKITLNFTHAQSDNSDIYWNIAMFAYSSGNYTEFYNQRIYANSGEMNKLASIGASAGTIYYIRISTYYNVTTGFDYNLENAFTSTNYYEKEINNDYSLATPMSFNQTYGGVMNDDNDVDVYKFTPTQNGKISLTFSHDYSSNSDIYWNIVMYAYSSGNYTEFYNQRIYANSGETNKLSPIGASSGTVYYIKIYTYYNATTGFEYKLSNTFTTTDYYEKEINNEYSLATPISLGTSYGGVMNDDDDIDNFKITISNSSTPFVFSHDYINNSDVYWNIKIIDASTYSEKFSKRIYGSDSNGVITQFDASGTYYIRISTYYTVTTNYEYSILIGNQDTTKPTGSISSTNKLATSQTVTLTLSDNVGIVGYYWGTSSNYSSNNFYQTSSKSVTDTVSSSGTYYLTVKDTSGNLSSTVSKTFYKTTLNANGGSVTPSYIITMNGNSFTFPTPSKSGSSYNGWSTSSSATSGVKTLTPTSNTTYYAVWYSNSDTDKPTGSISSTNKVASSQTVTLTFSDNVGIAGYYWGTSSNYSNNNYYQTASTSSTETIISSGTYYLTVKDTSGNLSSTVSRTFYKTNLNANGGSVTPTSVITMNGNSFTFPTPSKSGSSYNGWSTSSSATSGVKNLTPNSNTTYYAVWTQDQVVPTSVTLSETTLSLDIGESEVLTATVIPTNATNKTVNWTSSDSKVATVLNGKVTAVSVGTAKITAKTVNGKYAICQVTVKNSVDPNVPQIIVESKNVIAGNKVLVNISIKNNPGIWGMDLNVNYDKSLLTLTNVTNGAVFSSSEWTPGNLNKDKYILSYEASGFDDVKKDGVLATLEFAVNSNAKPGNTSTVSITYNPGDIINSNFEEISFETVSGKINIISFIYGDVNGDGLVNKKDSLLLKMYLADNSVTIDKKAADVYLDNSVNKKDSLYLKQYLAGLDVILGQ